MKQARQEKIKATKTEAMAKLVEEGLPAEVVQAMEKALKQIYESTEFKDAMAARGFGMRWRTSTEFTAFLKDHEEFTARIMTALNMVKK